MIKNISTKVFILFLILISKLPHFISSKLKHVLYLVIYKIFHYRINTVRLNLYATFPNKLSEELSSIEKKFYNYLSSLIIEIIQSLSFSEQDLKKRISLCHHAKQDLFLAEKENRNIFIITAHYGNWEYAGLLAALETKKECYGVYKKLNNVEIDKFLKNNRGKFGFQLIDSYNVIKYIKRKPNTNALYCFLADQTPVNLNTAYKTNFLGMADTPFYKGFAELAKGSNAIVLYASTQVLDNGHYQIQFKKITDDASKETVENMVEQYVKYLELDIKAKPEYWLWTHQRWKRAGLQY